jgi:hypothetical protein
MKATKVVEKLLEIAERFGDMQVEDKDGLIIDVAMIRPVGHKPYIKISSTNIAYQPMRPGK